MTHHDLLFPVEFQVRELDARLVLAAAALRRGERRVFLGTDPYLEQVVATLENGVYIGKSIRPYFTSNVTHYAKLKRANIRLLHLDEEGAVYMGGEHEWRQQLQARLDVTKLGPKDFVCAWGRFQASVFHELAHAAGPQVTPTGHPRLDLPKESYRALYAEEVADLRSRYGSDFVLVNGNYPRANHGLGIDYVFSEYYNYRASEADKRLQFVGRWAHFTSLFASMVEATHHLAAAFPRRTIVYRPHPSEALATYRATFRGVPNIEVSCEGPANPWLLAAGAVVHNGCTTAIEAHLAGTPVISFAPREDPRYDKFLPNAFGRRAGSLKELVACAETALDCNTPAATTVPERAAKLIANVETSSVERITALLDEAVDALPGSALDERALQARVAVMDGVERAKRLVRPFSPTRKAQNRRTRTKFPGLEAAELGERLARVERVLGVRVRAHLYNDQLARLELA